MTKEAIREILTHSQVHPVELVLTNGVRIRVLYADAVMFSPDTPELIAYGQKGAFKLVALDQIASVDVGPRTLANNQ